MSETESHTTYTDTMPAPHYAGDSSDPVKELEPMQAETLQQQLDSIEQLNSMPIRSELRESLANGVSVLPEGTLIHGARYNPEDAASMAEYVVLSGELFGKAEDGETHWCADFFRVEASTTVADYTTGIDGQEPDSGLIRRRTMESNYIPNPRTHGQEIGIIIDPNIPEVQHVLAADAYREGTDELFNGIINHLPIDKNGPKAGRVAAILGGVPRTAIAGVLISPKLQEDPVAVQELGGIFEGVPLIDVQGQPVQSVVS